MPYLSLSPKLLPATAPPETVFAFLYEDTAAAPVTYRPALLVFDDNLLAGALLAVLGFERDIPLPATEGLAGAWTFHRCAANHPFPTFTDDAGADTDLRISRFFDHFSFPAAGDVRRDPNLHVHEHSVPAALFNAAFAPGLAFVALGSTPSMEFAAADDSSDPAARFRLELQTGLLNAAPAEPLPWRAVAVELTANAGGGATDAGATLKVVGETVLGDEDGRVWFYDSAAATPFGGAIRIVATGNLELEIDITERPSIPLGPARLATLTLDLDALVARFEKERAGFTVIADAMRTTVDVNLLLEFPLVRGEKESKESFLVPWVNRAAEEMKLKYRATIRIDRDWIGIAGSCLIAIEIRLVAK